MTCSTRIPIPLAMPTPGLTVRDRVTKIDQRLGSMVDAGRAVAFAPRFRLDRIRVGPDRMGARRPVRATLRRANRSCDHRFWLAMPCAETGKRHDLPCVRGAPDMPIDDHEPAVCGCLISVRQLRLICVPWTPRDEAAMRAAIRLFRSA